MEHFQEAVRSLGGLHDAVPIAVAWNRDTQRVEIEIEDIHVNFRGLPEYKGATRGRVILEAVELNQLQLNHAHTGLKIYDWLVHELPDGRQQSVVTFSPEGKLVANHKVGAIVAGPA